MQKVFQNKSTKSSIFIYLNCRETSNRKDDLCYMNRIMEIPGFKGVKSSKMEQLEERVILHVSMLKKEHTCPDCRKKTIRVHDYRIRKIKHLKWFERLSTIFYKRRRYVCECGKRFLEKCPLVDRVTNGIQKNGTKWLVSFG